MKTLITLITLLLSIHISAQPITSRVEVLDHIELKSQDVWAGEASGIAFSLLQKTINDSSSKTVGVQLLKISKETIATQRGMAIDGNFNLSFGGSTLTRQKVSKEFIELTAQELQGVIDFINWSLSQKSPSQENEMALMYQIPAGLKLALNFQDQQWNYYFNLGEAEFTIAFSEGIELLRKLNTFKKTIEKD